MNKHVLALCVFLLVSMRFMGQNHVSWLLSSKSARFEQPYCSINPDSYSVSLSFNKKWNNKAGGEIGILKIASPKINIVFFAGGFINLHDFYEYQFLSWQLWRGNLGFTSVIEWLPLSNSLGKSSHLTTELAYVHESQHATDLLNYVQKYTNTHPYFFPNGSIRSFEFYKLQINYTKEVLSGGWLIDLNAGYKYFPQPKLKSANMLQTNAYLAEAGLQRRLIKKTYLSCKYYYEAIENNFIASQMLYKGNWNKQAFQYNIAEIGIITYGKQCQSLGIFVNFSNSNGRGLDFPEVSKTMGAGFRIVL